jgi:hypothetical protein
VHYSACIPLQRQVLSSNNTLTFNPIQRGAIGPFDCIARPAGDFEYGGEIVIDIPACVNVEVNRSLDGKEVTEIRQSQLDVLQALSNHKKKIIIPLVTSKGHKKQKNSISSINPPVSTTPRCRFKKPVFLSAGLFYDGAQGTRHEAGPSTKLF